jgi:hypothetical protein
MSCARAKTRAPRLQLIRSFWAERTANTLKQPALPAVESPAYLFLVALEFPVPASRAYWKGYLKLSLYPARLRFTPPPRRLSGSPSGRSTAVRVIA